MPVEKVELIPGFLKITDSFGRAHQIAIADVLRSADIPDVRIASLTLLTTLSQVFFVVLKTLEDLGIIGESLVEGYDLTYAYETLVDELAAEGV